MAFEVSIDGYENANRLSYLNDLDDYPQSGNIDTTQYNIMWGPEKDEAENGVTREEYEEKLQGPLGADWEEYKENVESSGNWDDEDCPPENEPDCNP